MTPTRRILFVDDEPNLLAGLRRMLRPMRHEWDMEFVPGGPEALELMAKTPVNVVVTDMRMPGMDGAELLRQVMQHYPNTIRIVLSGQADREAILDAVGPIHQYLSKPCDAETLKNTLTRACRLDQLLPNPELQWRISRMETVPSLPSLYRQVVGELQSPDASPTVLGNLISRDMGMSAKILQLVNSAFFGLRPHIPSAAQAVILLGLDTVKILGLSAKVFSQFEPASLETMSLTTLWPHSINVGEFARLIARNQGLDQKTIDYAFIAGQLHDVGKLVLAAQYPQQYAQVLQQYQPNGDTLITAERQTFAATHPEVGAYLMGLWGLPEPVVEALLRHHHPEGEATPKFTATTAVYVANILEYELRNALPLQNTPALDNTYLATIGVTDKIPIWRELCRKFLMEEQ